MRQVHWASWMSAVALAVAVSSSARADIASDRAAAIVEYPWVLAASVDSIGGADTVIQVSNTSDQPIDLHCFYDNANYHCTNTGEVCTAAEQCCGGSTGCGVCYPGWNETDFRVRLTPFQPLAWRASEGRYEFPIDGVLRVGRDGVSSNAGSRIPPVPENPFIGALKCIAVDADGNPKDSNVLIGEATLENGFPGVFFDVAKYNAVGIQAIPGAVNEDRTLVLGGEGAEYNGCPNVLILNHFAEFAEDPVSEEGVQTQLVLVPCTEDLLRQKPGGAVVQYLVYNEFEQRFSTSRPLQCQQALYISEIDTTQRERSVFSAGVLGTVTAQSRLTPIGNGLIGVAIESHDSVQLDDTRVRINSGAFNLHFQGDREVSDQIILP
jgi:hypothetical protein